MRSTRTFGPAKQSATVTLDHVLQLQSLRPISLQMLLKGGTELIDATGLLRRGGDRACMTAHRAPLVMRRMASDHRNAIRPGVG